MVLHDSCPEVIVLWVCRRQRGPGRKSAASQADLEEPDSDDQPLVVCSQAKRQMLQKNRGKTKAGVGCDRNSAAGVLSLRLSDTHPGSNHQMAMASQADEDDDCEVKSIGVASTGYTSSHLYKYLHTSSNLFKPLQTSTNLYKYLQTSTSLSIVNSSFFILNRVPVLQGIWKAESIRAGDRPSTLIRCNNYFLTVFAVWRMRLRFLVFNKAWESAWVSSVSTCLGPNFHATRKAVTVCAWQYLTLPWHTALILHR